MQETSVFIAREINRLKNDYTLLATFPNRYSKLISSLTQYNRIPNSLQDRLFISTLSCFLDNIITFSSNPFTQCYQRVIDSSKMFPLFEKMNHNYTQSALDYLGEAFQEALIKFPHLEYEHIGSTDQPDFYKLTLQIIFVALILCFFYSLYSVFFSSTPNHAPNIQLKSLFFKPATQQSTTERTNPLRQILHN